MTAMCMLSSFSSVTLAVSLCCISFVIAECRSRYAYSEFPEVLDDQ